MAEFEETMSQLQRDERFRSTVAAINTLLIQKGIYTQEEFEAYFLQSAKATIRKNAKAGSAQSSNRA